jgi:hypothetical protein
MTKEKRYKTATRCAFLKACYLAEELKCYGYMTDCPLFMKSNGGFCSEARFHKAMDDLIDKTRAKYLPIKIPS